VYVRALCVAWDEATSPADARGGASPCTRCSVYEVYEREWCRDVRADEMRAAVYATGPPVPIRISEGLRALPIPTNINHDY